MGSHGRGAISRLLLGSQTQKVLAFSERAGRRDPLAARRPPRNAAIGEINEENLLFG
jgi:hypothetical protein